VPLVLISAVWFLNRPTARGMAAVIVVLLGTMLLAPFFQTVAVLWPQLVFFGPSLFRADSPGLVVPHEWSYISMVIFWLMASAIFGVCVRRVKSFGVLLALAAVFVPATVVLVRLVVPLFGWRQIFEGP
jgi:hypothetical protein